MSADIPQQPITDDDVQESEDFLRQRWNEQYPNLDLRPTRVLNDLLIEPTAEVHALNEANIEAYQASSSLQELVNNPDLATDAIVDKVLSNYRITRDQGAQASGLVTIVLSRLATTVVPAGATFVSDGLIFATQQTFISTETTPDNATERLMTRQLRAEPD